jgi:N-glycosidase YbiA
MQSSSGATAHVPPGSVLFYIRQFDALDNFSAHQVAVWGLDFFTAEHAYQWKKFAKIKPLVAHSIQSSRSPFLAKAIAQQHQAKAPMSWTPREKLSIMRTILHAKAIQHVDVREVLLITGQRQLIEDSPEDEFWGRGSKGNGKNNLGRIWMEIRTTLRQQNFNGPFLRPANNAEASSADNMNP